nr:hypothetical protein [Tanacetum cinerariifolium]
GNPTFSSHPNLTSLEVKDDVFDLEGGNVIIEKLLDLDSTKDLNPPHHINQLSDSTTSSSPNHLPAEFADKLALITFPSGNDDLPFDIESDLKEIEYLLYHDPIKDMDSILEDSIDQSNLADLNSNLVNTMPEMFTAEHALDYSSPPLYDEYDDDLFEVESDTEYVYDDPFYSKGEKINESKLLIDELDIPSDFLPSSEYDSFLFEDFSESLSNEDVLMEKFKLYSNPLFDDEEIISTKIDPYYFNAESNLLESLLNRDTFIDSSPNRFDLEEEIRLVENLLYDNASPRPPEELNAEIADTILESLSPFPIPVEDNDSHMEEIDLFLATDDLIPPGIENEDYDSEGDIYFLEELLSNDTLPFLENESSNFDHHDNMSFPRPPLEPPDVEKRSLSL